MGMTAGMTAGSAYASAGSAERPYSSVDQRKDVVQFLHIDRL